MTTSSYLEVERAIYSLVEKEGQRREEGGLEGMERQRRGGGEEGGERGK